MAKVLRSLRKGEVVSYGDVAAEAGYSPRASRAVGAFLAAGATSTRGGGSSPWTAGSCRATRSSTRVGLKNEGVDLIAGKGGNRVRRAMLSAPDPLVPEDRDDLRPRREGTRRQRRRPARPRGQGAAHRQRGVEVRAHPAVRGPRAHPRAVHGPGLLRARLPVQPVHGPGAGIAPRRSPPSARPPTASPSRCSRRSRSTATTSDPLYAELDRRRPTPRATAATSGGTSRSSWSRRRRGGRPLRPPGRARGTRARRRHRGPARRSRHRPPWRAVSTIRGFRVTPRYTARWQDSAHASAVLRVFLDRSLCGSGGGPDCETRRTETN